MCVLIFTPLHFRDVILWPAARAYRALPISQIHRITPFLSAGADPPLFTAYRAGIICSRLIFLARSFAVCTVLWAVGDFIAFPFLLALTVGLERLGTAMSFATVAIICNRTHHSRGMALVWLALLLWVAMVFFLGSERTLAIWHVRDSRSMLTLSIAICYALMPFPLLGILTIFPLVASEGLVLSLSVLGPVSVPVIFGWHYFLSAPTHIAILWSLYVLAMAAGLGSISQTHLMRTDFARAAVDIVTGLYNRRVGEGLLTSHFAQAVRHRRPLSIAFLDIDDFKSINDQFGHEEGDRILAATGAALRHLLRNSDTALRWGGEEFVIIMPQTTGEDMRKILSTRLRILAPWRPDGSPLTFSGGIAEIWQDRTKSWEDLVKLSDSRMYMAKNNGKNKIFGPATDASYPDFYSQIWS